MSADNKKDLPTYAESRVVTGDIQIDEVLLEIANACTLLEDIGGQMDRARDDMVAALEKDDQAAADALKPRLEQLMEEIVEIENKRLPALLRLFQEVGREKGISASASKDVQKRLSAVGRSGDLDIAEEKGDDEDEESPWATE